mmetsp:Transcript_1400/g.1236  ORF Transcript_1400/g.1236 Transcript_1400/m.1236 type:complete len:374 (+) Transcript_1400:41-1162(+)
MNQDTKGEGEYKDIHFDEEKKETFEKSSSKHEELSSLMKFWDTKGWLICSLIASACFGIASFFMGEVSKNGIVAKNLLSLGFIIVAVIYMFVAFTQNYLKGIRIWSLTDNDWYFTNEMGETKMHWSYFFGMICSALANVVGTLFVAITFQTSIQAGVNQGVISTLFVLSAVFCAIFAYIFLKEVMGGADYVGFTLMIICAILLSLSQDSATIVEVSQSQQISTVFPVLAAIGSSLGFGIRSIFIKYYASKGYNVYNFAMQSLFVDGLIGSVYLLVQYMTTDVVTSEIILPGILSGLIAGFGTFLINYSISVGIAGPASAMANLAAVFQTIMDYFILGQVLNLLQIFGLFVGLIGALTLAVGYSVYKSVVRLIK